MKEINIRRKTDLTPRKSLLYNVAKRYKQNNLLLSQRYSSAKNRILKAEKYMNNNSKSLDRLNSITLNFIESQIRMQPQQPRGRCFTVEDKVFALSLYKQSGKAYKMLSKVFALSSRKCIIDMLKKIPFQTGINKRIFENLKNAVKKIRNKLDRFCTVIFDEIALSASLQYMAQEGNIIGFEDLGGSNSSNNFADKALVFMFRGCRKKFKQPVAFYHTTSGMKSITLSSIIKDVIEAVQSTGLTVVSTVCDQAPTNVAAINRLQKNTLEIYKNKNQEYAGFGFEIVGHDIVPLYDVPHLLKGLRNNLVSKDLNFEYEGEKHTASWKHIIQFYELDKNQSSEGDRLTPKLTDSHVYPAKLKKMKVANACQVFSQRVGAIMKRFAEMNKGL